MKILRATALLILGLLLPRAAALAPHWTERLYSNGCFPVVAAALGLSMGRVRSSVAQLLLGVLLALVLLVLGRSTIRAVRARSLGTGFGAPVRWVQALAVLVWSFELLWGINYARPPLAERLPLPTCEVTVERLARLTRRLAEETNRAYRQALESDEMVEARFTAARTGAAGGSGAAAGRATEVDPSPTGAAAPTRFCVDHEDIARHLTAAYVWIQPRFARLPLSRPKYPSLLGWIMTRLGISGVYFPYTGEASVNGSVPDPSIPYAAAHEMAHQRGTAREEEANFLAYLACHTCDLPCVRYGGALGAFGLASSALWKAAPDSARALHGNLLEPGPSADQAAISAFWRRHQGPAERAATRVNDTYLKAQAQKAGVLSYGRAVELLVAYEESQEQVNGSNGERR